MANVSWNGNTPSTLRIRVTNEKNSMTTKAAVQAKRSSRSRALSERSRFCQPLAFLSTLSFSFLWELEEPFQRDVLAGSIG